MRSERSSWCAALAVLLGLTLAAPAPVRATVQRVAIVKSSTIPPFEQAAGAIVTFLTRQPHQPEILTFTLDGDVANGPAVLAAVRQAAPSVIVPIGSLATKIVLADGDETPVVFSMVLYPQQSGFIGAGRRHVTGASLDIPPAVYFRYLRRLLPEAKRVGVLYHPDETGVVVDAARTAAAQEGFTLVAQTVAEPGKALAALTTLLDQADVIWAVADNHVFTTQTTGPLILTALRRRIPLFGLSHAHVRAGAVAALSCDYEDVGSQTAEAVVRTLDGAAAEGIPVSHARTIRLALNLRTAEHIGLSIGPDFQAEATELQR